MTIAFIPNLTYTERAKVGIDCNVISVTRNSSFAGKLGQRIEDVLMVRAGDRTIRLTIGQMHTACTHRIPNYHEGCKLRLKTDSDRKDLFLLPDQVELR